MEAFAILWSTLLELNHANVDYCLMADPFDSQPARITPIRLLACMAPLPWLEFRTSFRNADPDR